MKPGICISVRRVAVPALGLMLTFSGVAQAQEGRIAGRVVAKETGEPLIGASVEVVGPNLTRRIGALSDVRGHYAVESVPVGKYAVKVKFVGYEDGVVEGVEVIRGGSAQAEVRMVAALYELGEIVVSASRQAENIVDAPVSISKVDREEVQKNVMASSFGSMLRHTKGIDYTQTGMFAEAFNARGFNAGYNTRMRMVYDGVPTGTGSAFTILQPIPKDDVQDVEVITGPNAALYGPDAVASVISVMTVDPKRVRGTRMAVSGGSREVFKGRLFHAGTRGRWGWKLSGDYQRARDWEAVKTYYNADSSKSLTDGADFNTHNRRASMGLFYYPNEASRVRYTAGWYRSHMIGLLDSGRYQLEAPWGITQQLAYFSPHVYMRANFQMDDEGSSVFLHTRARYLLEGDSFQTATGKAMNTGRSKNLGAEARYTQTVHGFRLQAGVDSRQERLGESSIYEGTPVNLEQYGIYGHVERDLGPKLRLDLAAREDLNEGFDPEFSPKVGLIFKPAPRAAFRVTFSRAYRSPIVTHTRLLLDLGKGIVGRGNPKGFRFGTANGAPLPAEFAAGIPKIGPERNATMEAGFKGVLANRVYLDVTGYHSLYRNFISAIRQIGDPGRGVVTLDANGKPRVGETTLTYLNFGRQAVLGLDLGLNVYATDRVTFSGNASFIHAVKPRAGAPPKPFSTPLSTVNLGFSAKDMGRKGTLLDVSLKCVQKYYMQAGVHIGTIPTFAVLDANLGYRTRYGVTYRLTVQNLLDHRHIEFIDGARLGRIVVGEMEYAF